MVTTKAKSVAPRDQALNLKTLMRRQTAGNRCRRTWTWSIFLLTKIKKKTNCFQNFSILKSFRISNLIIACCALKNSAYSTVRKIARSVANVFVMRVQSLDVAFQNLKRVSLECVMNVISCYQIIISQECTHVRLKKKGISLRRSKPE